MPPRSFRPTDPLYVQQWHFGLMGRLGFGSSADTTGIERIWATYTGLGVRVGIWDDGVESAHWDLSANYDASRHVTVSGTLNDGQPVSASDAHGTSVAGLIAADSNGLGGVGGAFDASVTGVRIFGGADDINTAWNRYLLTLDSLSQFDITNHSYGGFPDWFAGADVNKFRLAAVQGRGGLGTINIKSAGNDNVDDNGDPIDASRFTFTIAAVDPTGQVASYSSYGAHILLAAPAGTVTTDRLGTLAGYNGLSGGDYTNAFGGTSAAAPLTASVVALMLDAGPGLGWRDVQQILARSAMGTGSLHSGTPTGENGRWLWNGDGHWNGGGMHFSVDYGFGLLNAFSAVRMAEVWNRFAPVAATSANERVASAGPLDIGLALPDLSVAESTFTVSESIVLEHVDLTLSLTHQYFTDLRINLISPAGTDLVLFDGSTGNGALADFGLSYAFGAEGYLGENSAGQWTLRIRDARAQDAGTLDALHFSGYGASQSTDDVYHYTDEVLAVTALPGQASRLTLVDTDGGTDWLNASAMSRNLVLSLAAGATSLLAGTPFMAVATGTQIEHAIAGDGDDVLFGNEFDNQLFGMRGDDQIDGGAGTDTAVFLGTSAQYQITQTGGVVTVTHLAADFGSDRLTNIEWIRFDDSVIEITTGTFNDIFAPVLMATAPADGAVDVLAAANLVFTFDESIQALAGAALIYRADGSLWRRIDTSDTAQAQLTANQLTLNPTVDLEPGQRYYVLMEAGAVADLAGNPFGGIADPTRFDFNVRSDLVTRTGTASADNLTGSAGHDLLRGLGGNDTLVGQAGNDTLDGGAGQDAMTGGLGDDVYLVDDSRDRVTESSNQGTDKIFVSVLTSYTLPTNVEHLLRTGGGNFTGNGTSAANVLTGGTGNDSLNGNGGDDLLQGLAGNDVLRGGIGRDELHGGTGNDRFVFSSAAEAGLGAARDVIADLVAGDRIDLSAIDANSSSRGDQAFGSALVGSFTGVRAQLQITAATDYVIVAGDIDGNRVADFEIQILGRTSLSAADFIL